MNKLIRITRSWFSIALSGAMLMLPAMVMAQDTLSLERCYQLAEQNWPLRRQMAMLGSNSELKVRNLNKNYLPQINVNGSASLQSDVTRVAIALPPPLPELDMPELSKDWYKLTLDVNQTIYDGNITKYQKRVEAMNLSADQKAVQIELYKLKDRINQIYFTIILIQQNEFLLKSNGERIESKLKEVEAGIRNGAVLEMNADMLKAELVRIGQQLTESRLDRAAAIDMLAELISTPVETTTRFMMPEITISSTVFENKRPEDELFEIQKARVMLMRDMVTTKWNPKFFAYGQAGYGRPGLNMLDNDFTPWWLVGAKLTWNPWNWNQNKNEKKIYQIQNDILKAQQETFDKNQKIIAQKDLSEIMKANELMTQDEQIIVLRARISRTASSQLDNGVITSSDYVTRLNEETQARLNLEIHKIQLVRAKLSYLYTTGKL
jgi:outer membrane protein TolC